MHRAATGRFIKNENHPSLMDDQEIKQLITELQQGFARTQEMAAFLELKQSELYPDDPLSLFGFMDAKEQLAIERSALSGHAGMVQELIQKRCVTLDANSQRILKQIQTQARQLSIF